MPLFCVHLSRRKDKPCAVTMTETRTTYPPVVALLHSVEVASVPHPWSGCAHNWTPNSHHRLQKNCICCIVAILLSAGPISAVALSSTQWSIYPSGFSCHGRGSGCNRPRNYAPTRLHLFPLASVFSKSDLSSPSLYSHRKPPNLLQIGSIPVIIHVLGPCSVVLHDEFALPMYLQGLTIILFQQIIQISVKVFDHFLWHLRFHQK